MPRESKLLTDEQLAIADKNGIPKVTIYKRLDRGWEVEKAITKPTRKVKNLKREDGLFVDSGRGERRHFSLPVEWEDDLTKAIAESGLSEPEWVEQVVIDRLKAIKEAD